MMMKTLVVLSLLAIASASTTYPLSMIGTVTGTITVTATYPDAGTAPVLVSLNYPTTYDSSAATLANFAITGSATFTGNNTIAGLTVTLTNGADTQVAGAVVATTTGNTVTFVGGGFLKFLNSASYSATVSISTNTFGVYPATLSTAFPTVAATAYVPPSVQQFVAPTPQTGGCDTTGCTTNFAGNLTLTPGRANTVWLTILRSPEATSGVRFVTGSQVNSMGGAYFNTDTYSKIAAGIGGLVSGSYFFATTLAPINTIITSGDAYAISGQATENIYRNTYFSESVIGAKQASVTLTGGANTDKVAPTCSVVTVSPTTVTTIKATVPVTLTITCADNTGGSGLWTVGYFGNAAVTSGSKGSLIVGTPLTAGSSTGTINIPPYISGTFTVTGVFAADNAGNVALYGSCAGASGFDSIGCSGGGSSSASTAAFSLVSIVVLALFALLKL